MVSNELLDELRQLPLADKLHVVQVLVNDLAASTGEALLLPNKQYEVWSPYESAGAAEALLQMLADEKAADG
jgi:hypothetical protein